MEITEIMIFFGKLPMEFIASVREYFFVKALRQRRQIREAMKG
jgi:hypothetical protein